MTEQTPEHDPRYIEPERQDPDADAPSHPATDDDDDRDDGRDHDDRE